MVKSLTKVIFKPTTQSTEEFMMYVNAAEYKKWKDGDTSIPLTEVVDSFKVFHSSTGNQGHLGEASKMQLENTFGSSKDIEVAERLLKEGTAQSADRLDDDRGVIKNPSRGEYRTDVRGSGAHMSGV